ncbi:MAG: hypothetical protein BroJett025_03980 [Patescibacteria group bacterium]|nr:MAG: hypothetical protein BroJett025_03980 [Patescibacteria group bacterium]
MIRTLTRADQASAEQNFALKEQLNKLLNAYAGITMPEEKFLEALGLCHELTRFLDITRLPKKIRLHGIKHAAKILAHQTKGKREGAAAVSYDKKQKKFHTANFTWGTENSVTPNFPKGKDLEPSFVVHNHPDKGITADYISFFSSTDFEFFIANPYMQFLVMSTKGRIFLILKTTKTAAAFIEHNFQQVIAKEHQVLRQKETELKRKKKRPLTADEFMELGSDFNQAICEIFKLGFYSSAPIPNLAYGNQPVDLVLLSD